MRFLLLLIVLSVSALHYTLAQELGFSIANGRRKARIPIEIRNNLIVVPVKLNGFVDLKFILDTGVRAAIFTEAELADLLGFTYTRKYTISGMGGEKIVDAYVTNNISLALPGIDSRGHAMLVLDSNFLELRNYLGIDVHGIMGYELFSRFIVEIDYRKKQLVVMTPDKFRKRRKQQIIPMLVQDTKPYIFAHIALNDSTSINAKLLVDTGASHALMLNPESSPVISVPDKNIESIIGRGLAGTIYGHIGRIKSISMGKYVLPGVTTNFPDEDSFSNIDTLTSSGALARNGAIGGEILSRFKVVFDFAGGKMYISKKGRLSREFFVNLSGMTVRAVDPFLEEYEINYVRENSPAAQSGLKEGDTIKSINGIYYDLLSLNQINAILNSDPGKKVRLEIEREGEIQERSFVLESPI